MRVTLPDKRDGREGTNVTKSIDGKGTKEHFLLDEFADELPPNNWTPTRVALWTTQLAIFTNLVGRVWTGLMP